MIVSVYTFEKFTMFVYFTAYRARFTLAPLAANDLTDFQCTLGDQRHVVCFCCMEMFPDRRGTADIPPVACMYGLTTPL